MWVNNRGQEWSQEFFKVKYYKALAGYRQIISATDDIWCNISLTRCWGACLNSHEALGLSECFPRVCWFRAETAEHPRVMMMMRMTAAAAAKLSAVPFFIPASKNIVGKWLSGLLPSISPRVWRCSLVFSLETHFKSANVSSASR